MMIINVLNFRGVNFAIAPDHDRRAAIHHVIMCFGSEDSSFLDCSAAAKVRQI